MRKPRGCALIVLIRCVSDSSGGSTGMAFDFAFAI